MAKKKVKDIAPELLDKIRKEFEEECQKSAEIKRITKTLNLKTATYKEANEYAIEVGKILASVYKHNLSSVVLPDGKMYYNIAKRVLEPTMEDAGGIIWNIAQKVQENLNQKAGIGIKVIPPPKNDKIKGIIDRVSSESNYDKVSWILDEPVKTYSQSIIDNTIKANAEFHHKSGMTPKIIRTVAGSCCAWCQAVAGSYTYPNVPKDVYRRHQRCRCTVDYYPGNGKVQNTHSKEWKQVKVPNSTNDRMGMKKIVEVDKGKEKLNIRVYKNDKYSNIYCQTNTVDSQKMCEYLNRNINSSGRYGDVDEIIVAKNETLGGLAAYNHNNNSFYISEELINATKFNKLVDTSYFAAKNLDDVLLHELGGHKQHWDSVYKYYEKNKDNFSSIEEAKENIEGSLLNFIKNKSIYDYKYISKNISENAFDGFLSRKNVLNELIADGKILMEKGLLKDDELIQLMKGVLYYDD